MYIIYIIKLLASICVIMSKIEAIREYLTIFCKTLGSNIPSNQLLAKYCLFSLEDLSSS